MWQVAFFTTRDVPAMEELTWIVHFLLCLPCLPILVVVELASSIVAYLY
jgi:hypothetical protein